MTDLDIITKPSRLWASIHANTPEGKTWIRRNVGDRESDAAATFPAAFVAEYAVAIARAGLIARIVTAAECISVPS